MTLAYFNAPTHSQSTHTGAFTSVAWLDLFEGPHERVQQHLSTSFLHLHNLALCVIPNVSALNFDLFKGVSSVWVTENTFRVVFGTDVNKQQKSECQSVVTQFVTVVHLPVVASTWNVCVRECVCTRYLLPFPASVCVINLLIHWMKRWHKIKLLYRPGGYFVSKHSDLWGRVIQARASFSRGNSDLFESRRFEVHLFKHQKKWIRHAIVATCHTLVNYLEAVREATCVIYDHLWPKQTPVAQAAINPTCV